MIGLKGSFVAGVENVGGKFLNVIKSMYVNSLACIRVKLGETKHLRIDSRVGQG